MIEIDLVKDFSLLWKSDLPMWYVLYRPSKSDMKLFGWCQLDTIPTKSNIGSFSLREHIMHVLRTINREDPLELSRRSVIIFYVGLLPEITFTSKASESTQISRLPCPHDIEAVEMWGIVRIVPSEWGYKKVPLPTVEALPIPEALAAYFLPEKAETLKIPVEIEITSGNASASATTTETINVKPTDKPTTKEQIMNEQVNTVNTPSITVNSGELALTLTIAPDAAVHSYLLSLSSLNDQKVAEATENPIGDNKPTEIKVPECLTSKGQLTPDVSYKLQVVAMDKAGNHSTPWSDNVRFDAKQLGIEPVPAPAPMPKPAPQPVKPVLPASEYGKFKSWVTQISKEIDAFLNTTTHQKNNDKRIAEWKTITTKMDDSIAKLEADFSDDDKQSLAGLKAAVKVVKELFEKAHAHNEELIRAVNQPNRRTVPPVTEPLAPPAPKPVVQATEDIKPVLSPPPTPVRVPTPTPSKPTASKPAEVTLQNPPPQPPAKLNPCVNPMTLVMAGLVGLVGLLLGMLIMQSSNNRHRVSDAIPPNDATASMVPDRIPWVADPRARAYFEKLIELGLLPAGGNLSWVSNSTMNGTNIIGGDNLVNGSVMIKVTLPPTNQPVVQPIIVVTNVMVMVTNTTTTTPQTKPECGKPSACPKSPTAKHAAGCTSCWLCEETGVTTLEISSDAYAQTGDTTDFEHVVKLDEIVQIDISRGTKASFGLSTTSSFEIYVDINGTYTPWTPTLESPLSNAHISHVRVRLMEGATSAETLFLRGICMNK